tara:strand:+ start:1252 stop:1485 length:234 start_codon:yes stop_codon:yes gene_type:complete
LAALTGDPSNADPGATAEDRTTFPIVGIGASAGSLAGLKRFFESTPADSDIAFIVDRAVIVTAAPPLPHSGFGDLYW